MAAAVTVLDAVNEVFDCAVDIEWAPGLTARDEFGVTVGGDIVDAYRRYFAAGIPILHGPAGGRFVYQLRAHFDLAVKITPVRPEPSLRDAAIVRTSARDEVDLLIFRDNAAGLYQGAFGWKSDGVTAFHEATYQRSQVERVLVPAIDAARRRRGRLAVVVKPGGVPSISRLWRDVAEHLTPPEVHCEYLEVDNACFQVVADPARFDVIAAPNLFGDILSDTAALLLSSRGMSYSANLGSPGCAVYQTAHGAAHDLVGRDVANPLAQILSMAWLLRASLKLDREADAVSTAIADVLGAGLRTVDIAADRSQIVGTVAMGEAVAARVRELGS